MDEDGYMDQPAWSALGWREMWENELDRDARARITRSVRRCQVLPSADEAVVAAELARQWMRRLRTMMVVNVLVGAVFGAVLVALAPPTPDRPWTYWFTLGLPGVWLATPVLGWWQLRRLGRFRGVCSAFSQEGRA